MTAKLDYRWHLRTLMAMQGLNHTSDLQPLLAERGITYSTSQVYRLVAEKPERLNLKALMALLDILDCRMDDLIEPVPAAGQATTKKAAGESRTGNAAIGAARPKRARIVE